MVYDPCGQPLDGRESARVGSERSGLGTDHFEIRDPGHFFDPLVFIGILTQKHFAHSIARRGGHQPMAYDPCGQPLDGRESVRVGSESSGRGTDHFEIRDPGHFFDLLVFIGIPTQKHFVHSIARRGGHQPIAYDPCGQPLDGREPVRVGSVPSGRGTDHFVNEIRGPGHFFSIPSFSSVFRCKNTSRIQSPVVDY